MCGIAGIFFNTPPRNIAAERQLLAVAMARLEHRGPDDAGIFEGEGILLGHRRLSILDLSQAGHQPMCSPDERLAVTFNGEIYNYLELREELAREGSAFRTSSDTEVLLRAVERWGKAAVTRFRGMFAFALWNAVERTLLVARDRIGERPLYYWRDADRFAFASELKALLALVPSTPRLSPASVDTYLHYQYVIEPDTMLDGVGKLGAGHVLEIGRDRWNARPCRYWDLTSAPAVNGDPVTTLRDHVEAAIDLTLRSDAPVGVALSGGIDSSLIAAIAARKRSDLAAFTVGYPGSFACDERDAARELAARLRIPWFSAELTTDRFASFFPELVVRMDEPIADVAAYGHYAVSRLAAERGVKVLLTGIGGDELFFGYGWVRHALRLSRFKEQILRNGVGRARLAGTAARRLLASDGAYRLIANRRLPRWWRDRVEDVLDYARLDLDHPDEWVFYQLDYQWPPADRFSAFLYADSFAESIPPRASYQFMKGLDHGDSDPQVAMCRLLFDSWLVSNCLALGDRVSMASAVETRVPLLDTALIEAVVGFWKSARTEDTEGHKVWLRALARDVLPADVLNRPKLGFTPPTREWIRAVNGRYGHLLADGSLTASGVLDADRLRQWTTIDGDVRRDFFLYKLVLLELWHRGVVDGGRL